MFSLSNREDAAVIRRQGSARLLVLLAIIPLIISGVAWKLPPGEAFSLAQHVDAQVGSHAIQPLTQALPIAQLLPVQTRPQEHLLRGISGVFLIAEQAVHIGIDWSSELLVEQGEPLCIFRKERRIAPWSTCRRLPYRVRMSPSSPP